MYVKFKPRGILNHMYIFMYIYMCMYVCTCIKIVSCKLGCMDSTAKKEGETKVQV